MNLGKYKWKSRILLVSTPNYKDRIYLEAKKIYQDKIKDFHKRYVKLICKIDKTEGITYPIPGNDDSTKSIKLYCDLISQAALDGISIQSQKVQEETQDKKEKPQKETTSKKDNKSNDLSDVSKTDNSKKIENLEENNDISKSEEKD